LPYNCIKYSGLKKINPLPPAIAWFVILTVLLTLPGSAFPKKSWMDNISGFDKLVHVGLFGGLTLLWSGALAGIKKILIPVQQLFVWVALGSSVYGVIMEYVQKYFIPNRSFDLGDILADTIGSIAGLVFATKVYIKR
jgi:VanZ family protein